MAGCSDEFSRFVFISILVVVFGTSICAGQSLKKQLREMQENYKEFKEHMEARNAEMEAKVTQLEGHLLENKEIIDRLESKIVQLLETKVQQQLNLLLSAHQRQNTTDDDQQQLSCDIISDVTNQSAPLIGMPSSCKDLKLIGIS